jgi:NAD(P)-dependent dehydrogenase (short-subunit alcohol dehydrogenase family)
MTFGAITDDVPANKACGVGLRCTRISTPLKRFGTVDEVAAMAIYLAGEVSSATNGAALRVDGGIVGSCQYTGLMGDNHTSRAH